MNLNKAVAETKKVAEAMPPPKWGVYQRFNDFKEYPKVLKELETRAKEGDFDHL